ncbi:uncharacterized protein LOC115890048 [Sitophilus oryzae]|uniref:Uncharacterized protein LOC115890048 n=1 Tax=Sitophilus oryzae TaxID=7048 RepID=A0A6J2YPQ1_SITOR|nr:uncharacterized protein LOC115890048 [Sitophilus oryzae]
MFPTFISILDIQSWWEVPSIAHFCSLFRTAFNLLDFDIEDLEEALLSDGTEESSWLQELIVRLLSGCLPSNEISTFNYQMFLRRLFRQKCQEHDRYNPFNTDCDFTLLPLRTKVDILHALCDFRLDAEDVLDQLKNLEADSLRVEPLGYDGNESAYWYFYGTRLYREDFQKKNNKKKSIWQVICFTEEDWFQLTKKFKSSTSKPERALHHTLSKNFLPELPRLFKEKERQARKRLLENQPRRTSDRLRKLDIEGGDTEIKKESFDNTKEVPKEVVDKEEDFGHRREVHERRSKVKSEAEEEEPQIDRKSEERHEMAARRKGKARQRKVSSDSSDKESTKRKKTKNASDKKGSTTKPAPVGRQTNNSLSAADGQIVIQPAAPVTTHKKKLKTSQVFQQTEEDLQVGMHKILDFVKNHDDAWPFVDPVEEEYAPNYYSIIRRPMDLTRMEDKLDQGYYKTYDKFRGDFQLIVNNCRLYNGVENEYTEMVDNLLKVFEKATEKYLDQISSSDEEIAVENLSTEEDNKEITKNQGKHSKRRKGQESPPPSQSPQSSKSSNKGKKPVLAAQGKRKERSPSVESLPPEPPVEEKTRKSKNKALKEDKKTKKLDKESKENKKSGKESKPVEKESKKSEKDSKKSEKDSKKSEKLEKEHKKQGKVSKSKKAKLDSKKENKLKEKEEKVKKRGRKKRKPAESRSRSASSMSPSPSPARSILSTPPPSSPECTFEDKDDEIVAKGHGRKRQLQNSGDDGASFSEPPSKKSTQNKWKDTTAPPDSLASHPDGKPSNDEFLSFNPFPFSPPKPKDKHNKLRETIEKLKAKNEISRIRPPEYDFEVDDHLKENKDKNKKSDKEEKNKSNKNKQEKQQQQQPAKIKKNVEESEDSNNASQSETIKKPVKKKEPYVPPPKVQELPPPAPVPPKPPKQSNYDALSLATEQTLKDINKWLDDTPKFDFSSASNSPSYLALDDFDLLGTPKPVEAKKAEKPVTNNAPVAPANVKKDAAVPATKEAKKKPFRDPSKFFNKRREVQRTIDRLQPGKGKGNLITNVQSTAKTEEIFPLGPLSKIKDTKNSLIVKTDMNAPKLSLGSVLDSFGKHKFVDDPKKDEEEEKVESVEKEDEKKPEEEVQETKEEKKVPVEAQKDTEKKEEKDTKQNEEVCPGGPTPNLSAWFKAFGAPKAPPPQKKPENKPESKEEESSAKSERVPVPDPSPSLDSPQPVARQRRISTGSSVSERSSFSQDLDSPRVGMDERGAYPAPYPSPLHRSPSSASPVMAASPRPDISPRSAYPFNGQMRVGFYQDTVSNKSSPDKSCSPRDNPQSPYYNASDHVYAPNTTQNTLYSYANSPYYTHPSTYSSTNPTPPYNTDVSSPAYYDTNKSLTDQYQSKPSQNYTANSPASSQPSPANQPQHSPHSPIVISQLSPGIHSPSVHSQHSPTVNSPQLQSPNAALHSPGLGVTSPQMSVHSPQMSAHSPQVNSPGVPQHSPNMNVNSPLHAQVNSPVNPASVESYHAQQEEMPLNENKGQPNGNNQAVFPVKKRAFVENDLGQFGTVPNEMVNRNMQLGQQLSIHPNPSNDPEPKQQIDVQGLLQQTQLLQHQQHMQHQKQALLRQVQQNQHQLMHQQQQQQQQNQQMQQKNQQLLQQQNRQQQQIPMPMYPKQSESSLSTPSPPIQTGPVQQQQDQIQQQQLPSHSSADTAATNLRNIAYSTSQTNPYATPYNSREAYPLNIPSARTIQQHQPKLDMSKFTNMGYTGPEVNFSRALQQQYGRPELNYTRTTVQSAISQASQLLTSQVPSSGQQQPGANNPALSNIQKQQSSQQTAHSYQGNRSVENVAERLAPTQVQQDIPFNKPDVSTGRGSNYNSASLDVEQRLNLGRNISNLSNIVDRYSNEQRMMAGLQSSAGAYYSDKNLSTQHMFNKTMSSASQIFSQANMAGMTSYSQPMATSAASIYSRQMNELQAHQAQGEIKASSVPAAVPEKKSRKKKSSNKAAAASQDNQLSTTSQASSSTQAAQGFQSYAGLKAPASTGTSSASNLEPGAISLKTSSVVPGSAFNFGPGTPGALGLGSGLYGESNFLDEFRPPPNFYMAAAAAHHRSTPENQTAGKGAAQSGNAAAQNYPSFLNPAHQSRPPAYPLANPFIPSSAQGSLMDTTSSQLYQHYLQAGVLNQGLLGPAGTYPSGYHPALAMRQPYDSISRPSWL